MSGSNKTDKSVKKRTSSIEVVSTSWIARNTWWPSSEVLPQVTLTYRGGRQVAVASRPVDASLVPFMFLMTAPALYNIHYARTFCTSVALVHKSLLWFG